MVQPLVIIYHISHEPNSFANCTQSILVRFAGPLIFRFTSLTKGKYSSLTDPILTERDKRQGVAFHCSHLPVSATGQRTRYQIPRGLSMNDRQKSRLIAPIDTCQPPPRLPEPSTTIIHDHNSER